MNGCLVIMFIAALFIAIMIKEFIQLNQKQKEQYCRDIDKLTDQYQLVNHWLEAKNAGKSAADFCVEEGYRHIAIYGMAELANRLMDDLLDSEVQVEYGIDQDASCSIARITEVYSLADSLQEVDAVIVTPIYAFDSIRADLEKKLSCPIVSLEKIIWSI